MWPIFQTTKNVSVHRHQIVADSTVELTMRRKKREVALLMAVLMACQRRGMELIAPTALLRTTWQDWLIRRGPFGAGCNAHRLARCTNADTTKRLNAAKERLLRAPPHQ